MTRIKIDGKWVTLASGDIVVFDFRTKRVYVRKLGQVAS